MTHGREYFNEIYAREDPWSTTRSPREHDRLARLLAAFKHSHFHTGLDIGCGEGHMLAQFRFIEHRTGVDISEIALNRAKAQYPDIIFQEGDIRDLSNLPTHAYDFISCLECLYYLETDEERETAIKKLTRLGTPGCVYLFSVVTKGELLGRRYFSLEGALALFRRHFNVLQCFPISMHLSGVIPHLAQRWIPPAIRQRWLAGADIAHAYQCAFICTARSPASTSRHSKNILVGE